MRLLVVAGLLAGASILLAAPIAWADATRDAPVESPPAASREAEPEFLPPLPLENPIENQQFEAFDTPPEPLANEPIQYPRVLERYGNIGKARVGLHIRGDGTVAKIRMLESPHPAFEAAIVDKIFEWRYKPALKDGEPVEATVIAPIEFKILDSITSRFQPGFTSPYGIPAQASAALPESLRYDTPPKLRIATGAVYPFELASSGTIGSALVAFSVSSSGRVSGAKVLEATHPEFGLSAAAMLESWEFEPAKRDGKPIATQLSKKVSFMPHDRDAALPAASKDLLNTLRKDESIFHALDQLDRAPAARYSVSPVYPRNLLRDKLQETVMIEFILDSEGRVHLPRIVEAAHPEFGWAAATALVRWRFEPPLRQGKPVAARLRIPFAFKPPALTRSNAGVDFHPN